MSQHHLFIDAHRRVCIAKQRGETDRARVWIGLATPSVMRPMINMGFARPVIRETPRVLNWYTFTPAGWAEYDRRFSGKPDYFSPEFIA